MPTNTGYIPQTKRKTALSISLWYGGTTLGTNGESASFSQAAATRIGSVESMSETETRGANSQYELDYFYPGEIADVIPTLPEREITLNKVVMYSNLADFGTGDIFEALGISGINTSDPYWNIMAQIKPITITRIEAIPTGTGSDSTNKVVTTVWENCWLTSAPKEFSVTGDLKIVQTCTLKCGRKYTKVS